MDDAEQEANRKGCQKVTEGPPRVETPSREAKGEKGRMGKGKREKSVYQSALGVVDGMSRGK
jgi:hypothetical protein